MGGRSQSLVLVATGVLLVAGPPFLTSYWVGLLTQMLIFAILAMSLDILLGYTGLPSLGHAAIFGVAAYAVAVLSTYLKLTGGSLRGSIFTSATPSASATRRFASPPWCNRIRRLPAASWRSHRGCS